MGRYSIVGLALIMAYKFIMNHSKVVHVCFSDRSDPKYRPSAPEGKEPVRLRHEEPVRRRDHNKDHGKREKQRRVRLDSQPKVI